MSATPAAMLGARGAPERPLVVVYNKQGRAFFSVTVQDLVLSALRHDPALRDAQLHARLPLAVSVAGVFVAPVKE